MQQIRDLMQNTDVLPSVFDAITQGWLQLVNQGGVIIYLLAFASLIGLAIILEKAFRLRESAVFDDGIGLNILLAIRKDDEEQLRELINRAPNPQSEIADTARESKNLEKDDMLSEMSLVANLYIRRLNRRVNLLGVLGRISPLLGLLGTVVGMIQAMGEVSLGANANPHVLAQGISQALITTAAGLVVGIPILFFHSLIRGRINRFASELEEFGHELMKAYHYESSGSSSNVSQTADTNPEEKKPQAPPVEASES